MASRVGARYPASSFSRAARLAPTLRQRETPPFLSISLELRAQTTRSRRLMSERAAISCLLPLAAAVLLVAVSACEREIGPDPRPPRPADVPRDAVWLAGTVYSWRIAPKSSWASCAPIHPDGGTRCVLYLPQGGLYRSGLLIADDGGTPAVSAHDIRDCPPTYCRLRDGRQLNLLIDP